MNVIDSVFIVLKRIQKDTRVQRDWYGIDTNRNSVSPHMIVFKVAKYTCCLKETQSNKHTPTKVRSYFQLLEAIERRMQACFLFCCLSWSSLFVCLSLSYIYICKYIHTYVSCDCFVCCWRVVQVSFVIAWSHKAQDACNSYILFPAAGSHRTHDVGKGVVLFVLYVGACGFYCFFFAIVMYTYIMIYIYVCI